MINFWSLSLASMIVLWSVLYFFRGFLMPGLIPSHKHTNMWFSIIPMAIVESDYSTVGIKLISVGCKYHDTCNCCLLTLNGWLVVLHTIPYGWLSAKKLSTKLPDIACYLDLPPSAPSCWYGMWCVVCHGWVPLRSDNPLDYLSLSSPP